jgi:repressor LexA
MGLTPKQKEILEFINDFSQKRGFAPSQTEIAKHFKFKSLGTVQNYLVRLEREGALQKTWNGKRSLQVIPPPQSVPLAATLPILGRVAAGRPIEALDHARELSVPESMITKGEHFALQVVGDSMIEDGILEGDFVVVRKAHDARNGQTVVASFNQGGSHGATVKRYFKTKSSNGGGTQIELHPANPKYQPMILGSLVDGEPHDFRIDGIVVGVIRRLE